MGPLVWHILKGIGGAIATLGEPRSNDRVNSSHGRSDFRKARLSLCKDAGGSARGILCNFTQNVAFSVSGRVRISA